MAKFFSEKIHLILLITKDLTFTNCKKCTEVLSQAFGTQRAMCRQNAYHCNKETMQNYKKSCNISLSVKKSSPGVCHFGRAIV
jgi:hypothetical protein